MNDFYYEPASRIRELRECNRFTREQLAELADISPKFLYEIETGKKGFTADTLYRISKALSVSSEYILTGKNKSFSEDLQKALSNFKTGQISDIINLLKIIDNIISNK